LILSGVRAQTLDALRNAGLYERIGAENFCEDLSASLRRADEILERKE
jgi:hypothetical protein